MIQSEIDQLQQKIKELEKKRGEQDEYENTYSIENNFKILNDVINEKTNKTDKTDICETICLLQFSR